MRADEGALAYESVKPGQGIVIDAWEVAALWPTLFGDGMQIKLSDTQRRVRGDTFPPLKNAPVAKLFVDGLRGAAQGNQPAMRFWADFIAELGETVPAALRPARAVCRYRESRSGRDQVSLILRRLAADLMIQERSKNQKGQWAPVPERDWTSARWERAPCDVERWNAAVHPGCRLASGRGPRLVLVQEGGRFKPALRDIGTGKPDHGFKRIRVGKGLRRAPRMFGRACGNGGAENMATQHRKPMPCSRSSSSSLTTRAWRRISP